jgi:hypothetical protein
MISMAHVKCMTSTVRTLAMQCNWLNVRNWNFTVFGRFSAVYLEGVGLEIQIL